MSGQPWHFLELTCLRPWLQSAHEHPEGRDACFLICGSLKLAQDTDCV